MSLNDLLANEDKIVTKMGAAFLPGNRVRFRDKDLHADACHMSWLELYVYGITGRKYTKEQIEMLNYIWTITSFPEPRIWTNRVAALAGSTRSTATLAISSAIAIAEGTIYGQRPIKRSMDFLIRAKDAIDQGVKIEDFVDDEIKKHKIIYGYSKAFFRSYDERVIKTRDILKSYGMQNTEFVVLADEVENILLEKCNTPINIAGVYAAIAAELGFSVTEYQAFMTIVFVAGMPPCFLDTLMKPEGSFLPLRCDKICSEFSERKPWD